MILRLLVSALVLVSSVAVATTTLASAAPTPPAEIGAGSTVPHAVQGAPLATSSSALSAPAPVRARRWLTDLPTDPTAVIPTMRSGSPTELPPTGGVRALAAADATVFRTTAVNGAPRNFADEVLEPSIATNGSMIFVTYNWYAAFSTDFGATFRYVSPFTNFPDSGSTFCCDQRVVYEPSRNLFIWLLQYGDTDPGFERVAVATPANAILNKWTLYDFRASDLPGTNATWMVDYAQLATSSNYLYLTMAVGPVGDPGPSATGIFRISLDQLVQGTKPLTFATFRSPLPSTITPVQGTAATMYFGQNISNSSLNLHVWPETGNVSTITISHTSTASARGSTCLSPDQKNVCGRLDSRVMSGWLGAGVIGFAWTAGGGSLHAFPYVQMLRINEAGRFVVDEPSLFSDLAAYIYPGVSLNARGDLGVILTAVSTARYPSSVAFMRDDISGPTQWSPLTLKNGTGSPRANEWGDYQTVVRASATANSWITVSWTIQPTGVEPAFYSFGRERDAPSLASPSPAPSGSPGASPSPSPGATPSPSPSPTPTPAANVPNTVYLPNITRMLGGPDGWQTPFIVQNVGTVATDLTMSFYAFADGTLVKTRTVTALPPGNSVFHDPNSDTGLPAGGQFSVVVTSSASPIVAVVNEHQNVQNTARQEALSYSGLSSGSTVVSLPYVAKQVNGWLTTFIMQNLGSTTANVQIKAITGTTTVMLSRTIAPGRSAFVDPTVESLLTAGSEYGVTLTSDQPIAVVVNAHNDAASVPFPKGFSYNGVPASSAWDVFLPYVARNADTVKRSSRLIVQNIGLAAARPVLYLRQLDANAITTIAMPQIQPGASATFDPTTATQLQDGEYSLHVCCSQFAIVDAMTTQTSGMGYTSQAGFNTTIYLPNITRTLGGPNGWTTPFMVQSRSTLQSTISVKFYRFSDGVLVYTLPLANLAFGVSHRVDPRGLGQLQDNTQYAVVINAPMGAYAAVTELNFSGGDGEMAYEGFAPPATGTSSAAGQCTPSSATGGAVPWCTFSGLPPGAGTQLTFSAAGGTRTLGPFRGPDVASDGTWGGFFGIDISPILLPMPVSTTSGTTWTMTIQAGGTSKSAQVAFSASDITVAIVNSSNGTLTAKTTPGVTCSGSALASDGSWVPSFTSVPQVADAQGNVAWSYPPVTTPKGITDNVVQCASATNAVAWDSKSFTVQ
jgi:hypothetical protein